MAIAELYGVLTGLDVDCPPVVGQYVPIDGLPQIVCPGEPDSDCKGFKVEYLTKKN
jgi:hypothetical protein